MDFIPPKINPLVMGICKWGLPLELWRSQISISVEGDGLARFRELRGKNVIVVCNHSNQYDPEVMFAFSKMVGEDFHFLAAREVFDWVFGSVGWWFQSLGCYSVVRGHSDIESFEMTKEIIARGERKLVIFPEGEVTRQPDFLLPLRPGATRLFFEGQERLNESEPGKPVLIQPMGIRWRYKNDITGWLDIIMRRIERRLNLDGGRLSLAQRVQNAASAMLTTLEEEYFCDSNADLAYEDRVDHIRAQILERVSHLVDVERPDDVPQIIWLRRVLNAIDRFSRSDDTKLSEFQRRLHRKQAAKLRKFVADCRRVQHLIGVTKPREQRALTQERLAAIVSQIERQVFGYVLPKGPRVAMVAVGQPFSLMDYWSEYQSNSHQAVEEVTDLMSTSLQSLIDSLDVQRGDRARVFIG